LVKARDISFLGQGVYQKNAAVVEGTTTAALLQMMRQPGEGDEAAAMSGLGGGRAILRTSAKKPADTIPFGCLNVAFQGHEDYSCVTNA
jgi:hypothetical protein